MISKLYTSHRAVKIISDVNAVYIRLSESREDRRSTLKRCMLRARARRYVIKKELPRTQCSEISELANSQRVACRELAQNHRISRYNDRVVASSRHRFTSRRC